MKISYIYPYLLFVILVLISCKTSEKGKEEENVQQVLPETLAEVTVITLQKKHFTHELISNGKLEAQKRVDLRFQSPQKITNIYVKNGDKVKKGQMIACLEEFSFKNKLQQAKDDIERSKLELQDMLIGQGYKLKDTASVPTKLMNLVKVKSGYNRAKSQYKMAQFNYQNSILKSPIKGVVANLSSKINTMANTSKSFCNIIDLYKMEVRFLVLENEMGMIQKGNKVVVTPFSMPNTKIEGKITEINPWVDQNGMVELKASVRHHPKMIEGMSVRVSIFRMLEKQWVVPKTAIVLRSNRKVVFVKKGDKAMWNYVNTKLENATECTITDAGGGTLKDGDEIIISGNVNLAHESPIKLIHN